MGAPTEQPTAIPDEAKTSLDHAIACLTHLRNETLTSGIGNGPPSGYQVAAQLDRAKDSIDLAYAEIFGGGR